MERRTARRFVPCLEELAERDPAEHIEQTGMDLANGALQGARTGDRAGIVIGLMGTGVTDGQSDAILQGFQKVSEGDGLRWPRERISTLHTAMTGDESVLAQFLEDVGYERAAQTKLIGDSASGPRMVVQVRQYQEGVVGLSAQQGHQPLSKSPPLETALRLYHL